MAIKRLEDYIPELHERFPQLSELELRKIVRFGLRIFSYILNRGGDVSFSYSDPTKIGFTFAAITGNLTYDSLKHYKYSLLKWSIKERILYSFKNTPWDGYYYFGIADEHHYKLTDQLNKKGTLKFVQLDHVFAYKAPKEIYHDHSIDHVYRLKYPCEVGYKIYWKKFRELRTDIEYVGINKESTWYRNLQTVSTED